MKKTSTRLADGRELIYYDSRDDTVRDAVDRRPLEPTVTSSQVRRDPLLGDAVAIASHRQGRTYHPPADECPLCPSQGDRLSEIPDSSYDVVVFENRFPSLAGDSGRCEVVCFTSDHDSSFADLTEEQAGLVLEAWTDRTAELSHLPSVEQVFCFENRGASLHGNSDYRHRRAFRAGQVRMSERRIVGNNIHARTRRRASELRAGIQIQHAELPFTASDQQEAPRVIER